MQEISATAELSLASKMEVSFRLSGTSVQLARRAEHLWTNYTVSLFSVFFCVLPVINEWKIYVKNKRAPTR